MKKSRVANVVMATLVVLTTNGCSLFAPKSETVSFNSEPQGAQVYVNNTLKGTTPCSVSVPCKGADIVVKKDGYNTQVYTIGHSLGTCGILDIAGTVMFLVPVFGLLSDGAYTLDQHTIHAPLAKKAAN